RVRRPHHRQHEDQPDVIRLPDGPHRRVRVVANLVGMAPAREQLPEARAEVGSGEDDVQREPGELEGERHVVEVHQEAPTWAGGMRAIRRSTHTSPTRTAAYTSA